MALNGLLPKDAGEILRRATVATYKTEFERTKAIEAAIEKVKLMYPEYFNREEE